MNIHTTLRTALLAMPGVAAIVGTRIWNTWPRTYTTPCIVIDVDEERETPHLGGQGELVFGSIVLNCRADTASQAHALQEAVRSGLAAHDGTEFDVSIDSTIRAETPKGEGSTEHWYDELIDCTLVWTEAA